MKVIYFQDPLGNFGDELNRWLWPRIFGEAVTGFGHHSKETLAENNAESLLFYGIGTILDDRIPPLPEKIIFGSGAGYGRKPHNLNGFNIFFVRGKKTAQTLGIAPHKAVTDPAILLREFFPLIPEREKSHEIAFMPHHSSARGDFWRNACETVDIHYIDPRGFDIETTIKEISGSKLIIAEAMHGAIVADAFRVPWIPVTSVRETNGFKWQDWCSTLGLHYEPVPFTPIFPAASHKPWKAWINALKLAIRKRQLTSVVRSRHQAQLSDEEMLDACRTEMDLQVQELQAHLRQRGRT